MDISKLKRLPTLSACRAYWKPLSNSVPNIFSVALFLTAALLLFSTATPAEPARLRWIYKFIPLSVMEASHLVAGISGLGLMFLSLAIRRRVDSAYYLTLACLAVAIFASLLKGWDVELAALLSTLLLLFIPTRKLFFRRSQLLSISIPWEWLALSLVIILLAVWMGFYSYKHTAYSNDLWLKFSLRDDPSRFLRTLFTMTFIGFFFLVYRFFTRTYTGVILPDTADIAEARTIVARSPESMAYLALMQDKYLFWSPSRQSFIMYGITPKYWIAMGDPIGLETEFNELIWAFREEADRHSARIAFYEVGNRHVSLYLDAGMSLMKIGEQARLNLISFSMDGKKSQRLRQTSNKFAPENLTFEVVDGPALTAILPRLKTISDEWLKQKRTREKGFSLGSFDETYLAFCKVAVIKNPQGEILAFSNLLMPDNTEEISLDLMRYDARATGGIMEYLTIQAILWSKQQGYTWFNLGMAPLAGLYTHPLSSLWHKVGHLVFRYGGEFYNFKGLYQYKNKFSPEWKSRYLACPGNLSGTAVLLAVAGLIARGFKGIFKS